MAAELPQAGKPGPDLADSGDTPALLTHATGNATKIPVDGAGLSVPLVAEP